MKEAIISFFTETVGEELCVFLCSMIPIIELRGAIPLGAGFGLPFWESYLISVIGNMLPVPLILLCIKGILNAMSRSRVGFLNKTANWLFRKAEKNRGKVEKYTFFGLFLFVAIPLPGTGAWTGSLVAAIMNMRFRKAFLSVLLGVMAAGVIMTVISYAIRAGVMA